MMIRSNRFGSRQIGVYFLMTLLMLIAISCGEPKEGSASAESPVNQVESPASNPVNQANAPASKIQLPDTYPLFPGCEQEEYEKRRACSQSRLIDMLHRVVKYPDMRLEENPAGIVIHSFIVEADGTMSDLKLEKSLSQQCDKAAKEAIIEMFELAGPWEPATLDGKKVSARYSLPIQFQNFE